MGTELSLNWELMEKIPSILSSIINHKEESRDAFSSVASKDEISVLDDFGKTIEQAISVQGLPSPAWLEGSFYAGKKRDSRRYAFGSYFKVVLENQKTSHFWAGIISNGGSPESDLAILVNDSTGESGLVLAQLKEISENTTYEKSEKCYYIYLKDDTLTFPKLHALYTAARLIAERNARTVNQELSGVAKDFNNGDKVEAQERMDKIDDFPKKETIEKP